MKIAVIPARGGSKRMPRKNMKDFYITHDTKLMTKPFYQEMGLREGDFPISELYYSRTFSIPMFQAMTEQQQTQVADALKTVLQ